MVTRGDSLADILDRLGNLIVICVPPALPAAMSCGIMFAVQRLLKQEVFCIAPDKVNMAGLIDTFVFDKTGTLTETGVSMHGFWSFKHSKIIKPSDVH
jgi:cation-transporting P-type ATPase 13A2